MNIFKNLPTDLSEEVFEDLIKTEHIRIERIVSKGQSTPEGEWYDQTEHEWVLVFQGYGIIEYPDGQQVRLNAGDCLNIPAHHKHRVAATCAEQETIWLAIFYR
ncbi:cupin domain-containing protein [Catenovulum sp. SM1970]|nr:cupin domain-containing protein [Marinifaba aquimaris]